MTKSAKSGLAVFIILIILGGGCIGYSIYSSKNQAAASFDYNNATGNPSGVSTQKASKSEGKEYIAALYVEGTIEDANSTYTFAPPQIRI